MNPGRTRACLLEMTRLQSVQEGRPDWAHRRIPLGTSALFPIPALRRTSSSLSVLFGFCLLLPAFCIARAAPPPEIANLVQILRATHLSEEQRFAAVNALRQKGRAAHPALLPLVDIFISKAESRSLRLAALSTFKLISTNEQIIVPALMIVLKDKRETEEMRAQSFETFQQIAAPPAVFAGDFARMLCDTNENQPIRRAAARALESIAHHAVAAARTPAPSAEARTTAVVLENILKAFGAARLDGDPEIGRAHRLIETQRDALAASASSDFGWDPRRMGWLAILFTPLVCLPVWLLLLWRAPLGLWRANEFFRRLPEFQVQALAGLPLGLRGYLLLSVFESHPRVLDAWLESQWPTVALKFGEIQAAADRGVHLPLPILLEQARILRPAPEDFHPVFRKKQFAVLIRGESGSGKTSLAIQMAKWAMDESADRRLGHHRMLPAFIDAPRDLNSEAGLRSLWVAVQRQAQPLLADPGALSLELVQALLQRQRILVILDHFSQVSDDLQSLVERGVGDSAPVKALVITAQVADCEFRAATAAILALPMEADFLAEFLSSYLKQKGKRDLFSDREFLEAAVRLSELAGDRNITVLLAKIYAELMVASKEFIREHPIPGNIPDMFLSYLEALNQNVPSGPKPDSETVARLAKTAAWECLKLGLRPHSAKLSDLAAAFSSAPDVLLKLPHCWEKWPLLQAAQSTEPAYRFTFDSFAEYFGALRLIEMLGPNEKAWRNCLTKIAERHGSAGGICSFLLTLRDCCRAKSQEAGIPEFVERVLGRLVGADPTGFEQARLRLRISRLIQQLLLPNAEDRRNAVVELESLGPVAAPAVPALVAGLSNADEHLAVRHVLLRALGEIGAATDGVVPVLIQALQDGQHRLRATATQALVKIGDRAVAGIADRLRGKAEDEEFRVVLASTLGAFEANSRSSTPILVEVLRDKQETEKVRAAAAESLGRMGLEADIGAPVLIDLILEGKSLCRSAAKALIGIVPSSKPLVISLLEALNPEQSSHPEEVLATFRLSLGPAPESIFEPAALARHEQICKILEAALATVRARRSPQPSLNGTEKTPSRNGHSAPPESQVRLAEGKDASR